MMNEINNNWLYFLFTVHFSPSFSISSLGGGKVGEPVLPNAKRDDDRSKWRKQNAIVFQVCFGVFEVSGLLSVVSNCRTKRLSCDRMSTDKAITCRDRLNIFLQLFDNNGLRDL